ncbi:MAG: hypothetical protein JZD41_09440 [Thermoproteus sp.]|nr:hypothetical protein [Thermoproteus sp.]
MLALGHLLMDVQLYVSAPPRADEAAPIWELRYGGEGSALNLVVAARRMGAEALKELLSRVDYLFLNEREFEALLGGGRNKAFDLGVSLVVVKRGSATPRPTRTTAGGSTSRR